MWIRKIAFIQFLKNHIKIRKMESKEIMEDSRDLNQSIGNIKMFIKL